jgi:hypothetical protein
MQMLARQHLCLQVASSSHGDIAVFPPHSLDPQIISPATMAELTQPTSRRPSRPASATTLDQGEMSSTEDEDEEEDGASAANQDIPRLNRFQLAPDRVSRLRVEHQPLSRSQSPSTIRNLPFAALAASSNGKSGNVDPLDTSSRDRANEKELREWRRLTGVDIGVVMRRRAELGYGLEDVRAPFSKASYSLF